jgi:hypothetical protein
LVPQASCSVPTDERGDPRPDETGQVNCDAGAYEIQSVANTQTISFTSTPPANNHVYSDYIPTASSTSGLPVKLNLDVRSQGCDFNNGVVYYVAAGTCLIDATQAGDASYLPAPKVQQAIEIFLVVQTVTFSTSPPSPAYVGGTYTPAASATSNDPVTFSIDASSTGCGVSGGVVSFTSQGTCVVDAVQAGGFGYAPAEAQQSFVINQLSQTVSFTSSLADPVVGGTYRPAASATSGLTPVISLQSGSTGCTLKSGTVRFTADGTCLLEANQAGSLAYAPAPEVDQSLAVATDGLVSPLAVSSDGIHVWVANTGGNSVTELNAPTGALVAVLHASNEKFDGPSAISSDGTDVWVANAAGNSVTELRTSDGSLVRVLSNGRYKFDDPSAISSDGTDVWVANLNGNPLTEIAAATGDLVKVLTSTKDAFDGPSAVDADGTHVWVADEYGNSVTELDAGSGTLVRVIRAAADDISGPDGISSDRTHVWVSNFESNSVTELKAANGTLTRVVTGDGLSQPESLDSDGTSVWVTTYNDSVTVLKASTGALVAVLDDDANPGYDFAVPVGVSSDGTDAWVTNYDGNSVTEMGAPTGALVRVISG